MSLETMRRLQDLLRIYMEDAICTYGPEDITEVVIDNVFDKVVCMVKQDEPEVCENSVYYYLEVHFDQVMDSIEV